ncbi:hypothetical protein ZIOFF_005377 [Zingiber officinale]|uniref:Uncharacterized protein n=1 Tax=Zingiber officinale TaxID=94328 RepID=A0A8J5HQW5_ZINOF|nr:hypothetical protein ZIOFF_005377 [Zingiber officinale]
MLGMNLWGTIYNVIYMFGWPHASDNEAVRFCQERPEAAWDILMYCLCGAVGQNFIFLTISQFGSLANTTIVTTRNFVSIIVSSLISGNSLSTKQWSSVVMVFSDLLKQTWSFRSADLPCRFGLLLCRPALVFRSVDLLFRSADLVFCSGLPPYRPALPLCRPALSLSSAALRKPAPAGNLRLSAQVISINIPNLDSA